MPRQAGAVTSRWRGWSLAADCRVGRREENTDNSSLPSSRDMSRPANPRRLPNFCRRHLARARGFPGRTPPAHRRIRRRCAVIVASSPLYRFRRHMGVRSLRSSVATGSCKARVSPWVRRATSRFARRRPRFHKRTCWRDDVVGLSALPGWLHARNMRASLPFF